MIFTVSRTSSYSKEQKPCEECTKKFIERWTTKCYTEERYNEIFSERWGLWRSRGRNHSVNKEGCITRQEADDEFWVVEIKTFKNLKLFVEKYGEIAIIDNDRNEKMLHLEIIDDWRN